MVLPRRAKCPLTGLGAMRRELEPFKRQLAQGRRHLADNKYDDVSKYRREREDNQLLRPVSEVLGRSNNFGSGSSASKNNNGDDDLLLNPNDYLEKQHIDEFTNKDKEMPEFLQPIDDLLERASNRHDVTEANRASVTSQQSRNGDFLDYDLLMLKHKRAQEKRHLQMELAKFTSPQEDFLTAGGRAPVKEPASYRKLRSRHDDVMNASMRKMNSIEDDEDLLLPCSQEVLKYTSPSGKTPTKKNFDDIMTSHLGDASRGSTPELLAPPTTFDYKKHEEYFPFEARKRVREGRERSQCRIPQNFDEEF